MLKRILPRTPIVTQIALAHLSILALVGSNSQMLSFCVGAFVLSAMIFRKATSKGFTLTCKGYTAAFRYILRATRNTCYATLWAGLGISSIILVIAALAADEGLMLAGFTILTFSVIGFPALWLVKVVPIFLIAFLRAFLGLDLPTVPQRVEVRLSEHAVHNERELDELKAQFHRGATK